MTDFAAIDFETANECRSSVCSVGVVVVRGGEISDCFYSLIHPEPEYYKWFCHEVHGLSEADTHGCHRRLRDLPEADVIVHSGDITVGELFRMTREELLTQNTADKISALRELCEEFCEYRSGVAASIDNARDAARLMSPQLKCLDHEECWVLLMDRACHPVRKEAVRWSIFSIVILYSHWRCAICLFQSLALLVALQLQRIVILFVVMSKKQRN